MALSSAHYPANLPFAVRPIATPPRVLLPFWLHNSRAAAALGSARTAVAWSEQALTHTTDPVWIWRARIHLALALLLAGEPVQAEGILAKCCSPPNARLPERVTQLGILHLAAGRCCESRGLHRGALAAYARAGDRGRETRAWTLVVQAEQSRAYLLLLGHEVTESARHLHAAALHLGDATPAQRVRQVALRILMSLAEGRPRRALPLCESLLWHRPNATDWDRTVAARVAAMALPHEPWRTALLTRAQRWAEAAGDARLTAYLAAADRSAYSGSEGARTGAGIRARWWPHRRPGLRP